MVILANIRFRVVTGRTSGLPNPPCLLPEVSQMGVARPERREGRVNLASAVSHDPGDRGEDTPRSPIATPFEDSARATPQFTSAAPPSALTALPPTPETAES